MNSCIIPAMTYGAQSWILKNKMKRKLIATQSSVIRSLLGVTKKDLWKIEELQKNFQGSNKFCT